ncbi:MAG: BMP family ABC transporter substrate-binding protein [Lachnospiraceae bacterium]|nr:BMP family ABC transporter substrate-binding protein [Lachnospiraceae bacterium]
MKKVHLICLITCALVVCVFAFYKFILSEKTDENRTIDVGFVYDGDESTPYTANFIQAQRAIEYEFGDKVICHVKSNVSEEDGEAAVQALIDEKCDLIFTTSYGYGEAAKKLAVKHPEIQFCQATCDNANDEPVVSNYHTFMGEIYQGRYIAGVVAGMKLQELLDNKDITESQLKVGYVGAFPYAEVISGYTAFLLGIRSVVPKATMTVKYADTWSNYNIEKKLAEELIDEGCVIISQHSDTIGPAVACENAAAEHVVYHVGYNQSMIDVAPTTSLISTGINWNHYMLAATRAVFSDKKIENVVDGNHHGNDIGAGFEQDWVQMMELNSHIAPDGAAAQVQKLILAFKNDKIKPYVGDYTGVNPFDETDTIDLKDGYDENATSSAPSFGYVLKDVITIE